MSKDEKTEQWLTSVKECRECNQKLLSGYKEILLKGIDKLEKKRAHPSPYAKEVYRIALNDVRYLMGIGKGWGTYKKEKK